METLGKLIDACERLANDQQAPAAMVDWACALYDSLTNGDAHVLVNDLRLLSLLAEDYEQGKSAVSYALLVRAALNS